MDVAAILKTLEGSFTFQLIAGITAAIIIGFKMVEQFRKGLATDPPKSSGEVVEIKSWHEIAANTHRSAEALERIAESFRIFNKREMMEAEREMMEAEREERDAMRKLLADLQRKVDSIKT